MVDFSDINRIPGFRRVFAKRLGNNLEKHVEETYNTMIRNWEQGRDATGKPWDANAPSTLERKRGSTPLIDTRQMIESAEYNVDPGDLSGAITIDAEYAGVHEFGAPDQNIPARPILSPAAEHFNQNTNAMVRRAVDYSIANAALSGISLNFGSGSRGGSP